MFHDDQHGTAITVAAAVRNGLLLQGKTLADVRLVTSGAGAAALACVDLLVAMGLRPENVTLTDIKGVVRTDRPGMLPNMARYARDTNATTLAEVLAGADVFLGLSAPRVLKPEWLPLLADKPLILALANPDPEIAPDMARAARPDAIVATGRSDYPNQVNNVLCFPFIFRGALDVSATTINEAMKIAAVEAIAGLARMEASEVVAAAYGGAAPVFGPDYIIPKPFDPRLILEIAPAVARAAMDSGVARRPIADFDAYRRDLERFVFRSGQLMRPVFEAAQQAPKRRIVFAEGEDERVLRAAQTLVDDGIAAPDPARPARRDRRARCARWGCASTSATACACSTRRTDHDVFGPLIPEYQRLAGRRGAPPEVAARRVAHPPLGRRRDAAACRPGRCGDLRRHRQLVAADPVHPADHPAAARGQPHLRACPALILPTGALFICDTHMVVDPTAEQITEMTLLAAEAVRGFGIAPKAALLSHSSFGASDSESARKMRRALAMIRARDPALEIDGEMHADAALVEAIRNQAVPDSRLHGAANLLIMPSLDAANIAFNLLKAAADGLAGRPDPAGHVAADPRAGAQRHRARHRQPERSRGLGGGGEGGWCGVSLRLSGPSTVGTRQRALTDLAFGKPAAAGAEGQPPPTRGPQGEAAVSH